jgi:MFS family permease
VLIVAPIAGAFAKRTSPLVPLVAATVLGIVTFAALAGHHDQQWPLYLGSAAWGTTVALGLVATFALVVEAVPLAGAGSAASITTLGQAVGSASGTAVFTAALTSELVPGTPVPAGGGYTRAFVAAALLAAAALVCSLVTVAVRAPRAWSPRSPGDRR